MILHVIGFTGPARCGKDTAANLIHTHCPSYRQSAFANPLKEMLRVGLNLSMSQIHGDQKDQIDPRYKRTPRHMMQTLGTEWGREQVNPHIWVIAMEQQMLKNPMLVSDVRFANEADLIRKHGQLVHITGRDGIIDSDHVSETRVEYKPGDAILDNSGTLLAFKAEIERYLAAASFVGAQDHEYV